MEEKIPLIYETQPSLGPVKTQFVKKRLWTCTGVL